MENKIIQKDITFDMSFTFPLIGYGKACRLLAKNYSAEDIKKTWTWRNPFYVKVVARVNVNHNVDIVEMRKKQHELLINKKEKE